MKSLIALVVAFGTVSLLPTSSDAAESTRNRDADVQQVADVLGLDSDSYHALSVSESEAVRGTGGLLHLPKLRTSKIGLNAKVRANVHVKANVLNAVKVNTKVRAKVKVNARARVRVR